MAIFHLSVKTISRSAGRSATAAAAYRAGAKITDERTGEIHDYTRKGGVESAAVILPDNAPEWARDRAQLWNAAEQAEKRKNSTVAREFEIALPAELSPAEREKLAHDFTRELVNRHGMAADVAIHAPGKEGDNRNHHAHILLTTRRLGPDGLGEKTRELDDQKTGKELVKQWRERFATLQNERLREAGHVVQVDHRSHAERGLEAEPTRHLGPTASAIERRTGERSRKGQQHDQDALERLARAREAGELERQEKASAASIIDLSGDIEAAKRDRAELMARQELERRKAAEPTGPDPRSRYHPDNIAARQAAERAAELEAAQQRRELMAQRAAAAAAVARKQPERPTPAPVRAPQPALVKPDPNQVERQRIERMNSTELAAEIGRLRPPRVLDLVERDPAVLRAERERQALQNRHTEAGSASARARDQAEAWREAHKVQAMLHDNGVRQAPALRELEERREANRAEWQKLGPQIEQAGLQVQHLRSQAHQRISAEQAPALAKVAELEALRKEKVRQEFEQQKRQQAERTAERERAAVPENFAKMARLREMGACGWSDRGSQWQATPAQLKQLIDGYNAATREARAAILDRLTSDRYSSQQLRKLLDTQQANYRENDQGISR